MLVDANETEGEGERSGDEDLESEPKSLPERMRCSMSAS